MRTGISEAGSNGVAVRIANAVRGVAGTTATGILTPIAVVAVSVIGFLIRLDAAERLPLHVDEPHSLLAVRMVAERGVPLLPSGVLYLQGTTLSYLMAPLVGLGLGDLDDLFALRVLSVAVGAVTVYLTFRLGRLVAGSDGAGLLAAVLVALDPLSVTWSAHVRMYAPLQMLTLLVVLLFVREIAPGPPRGARSTPDRRDRSALALPIAYWLAVFTHVNAALLWPAMAFVALLLHGRALFAARRRLGAALVVCFGGPVALVAANSLWGNGSGTVVPADEGALGFAAFVGDHHVDLRRILEPDLRGWTQLFQGGALAGIVPTLVAVLTGLVAGRVLLAAPVGSDRSVDRQAVGAVLALYWVPILVVAAFTTAPQPRYLLLVQPLGMVLVAAAVAALRERSDRLRAGARRLTHPANLAACGVALLLIGHLGDGLRHRLEPVSAAYADYVPALRYVAAHQTAGEPIIVGLPTVAYLALGDRDELRFLSGPEDGIRTERYTRQRADGVTVDYWIGMPALDSVADLCAILADRGDAWLIVDQQRVRDADSYRGPMADVLFGATIAVFRTPDRTFVLRPAAPAAWTPVARQRCSAPWVGCRGGDEDGARTAPATFNSRRLIPHPSSLIPHPSVLRR